MLRLALTPRWLAGLLLALILVTVFVALSMWQVDRAQHKNDADTNPELNIAKPLGDVLSAQVPMSNDKSDQMVSVTGEFLDMQVAVAERLNNGTEGYWVVTFLAIDGATLGDEVEVVPAAGADVLAGGTSGTPIAIPVIRGWAATEDAALNSPIPAGPVDMVARLGPTEGPVKAVGERTVRSVSTAQLVNFFDVYSYGGILFPDEESFEALGQDLAYVGLEPEVDGGLDVQSAVYAIEWLVFAAFALYMWWRLLRDEYEKRRVEASTGQEFVVVKKPGERLGP